MAHSLESSILQAAGGTIMGLRRAIMDAHERGERIAPPNTVLLVAAEAASNSDRAFAEVVKAHLRMHPVVGQQFVAYQEYFVTEIRKR